jgi:hypothetical protein
MKNFIFIFLTLFTQQFVNAQISLGLNYNLDVYKPYTTETREYMKFNDKVKSNTFNITFQYNLIEKSKYSLNLGFSYKNINYVVQDKVLFYYEYAYLGQTSPTNYVLKNNILDLKSRSHSFGTIIDFSIKLKQNDKTINEIGLLNEIYLFEYNNSAYYFSNSNESLEESSLFISPLVPKLPRNFFFSSSNLCLFYRLTYKQSEKISMATKISLGTNLYSDWDQFKKYAWLGVGLEIGFGKKFQFKEK